MPTRLIDSRAHVIRRHSLPGGWFLLILFLQAACATGTPPGRLVGSRPSPATVYVVGFLEPGAVAVRPVPLARVEFQQALVRLSRGVRLGHRSPRQAGKVLGEDAARALILAVTPLGGYTLGQMAARVQSLPAFNLAAAQFEAQGGGPRPWRRGGWKQRHWHPRRH